MTLFNNFHYFTSFLLKNYFYRYDDVRSPLPQSISQMSLYNNNASGNVYQQSSGIIEPLPFHHNHRPVPIPPSSRSLISDYNPSGRTL